MTECDKFAKALDRIEAGAHHRTYDLAKGVCLVDFDLKRVKNAAIETCAKHPEKYKLPGDIFKEDTLKKAKEICGKEMGVGFYRNSVSMNPDTGIVIETDVVAPPRKAKKFAAISRCAVEATHEHAGFKHFHMGGCHWTRLIAPITLVARK